MKLNKCVGAMALLAGVSFGTFALAATTPVAPVPVGLSVSDLTSQSQSNIAMAQMLFKLGQMQGELAGLKQQQETSVSDSAKMTVQLKTAQDQLKASQAQLAERSKPRCDGASYLPYSAPVPAQHQFEQKFTIPPSKR